MNQINFIQKPLHINFIDPLSKKGRNANQFSDYDASISIALKGKIRNNTRYEFNIKHLSKKFKINHWKYIKVGIVENSIVIVEGTSADGYLISKENCSITNKNLIETIFRFMNIPIPTVEDSYTKHTFKSEKFDKIPNCYKLVKI